MLMDVAGMLLKWFEVSGALKEGWLQAAQMELEAMSAACEYDVHGPCTLVKLQQPEEFVFPFLDGDHGDTPLSDYGSLTFKEYQLKRTRELRLVLVAQQIFERVGVPHFNYLMLRHGWCIEQRIFWDSPGARELRSKYQNKFTSYVAAYQRCKLLKTVDVYMRVRV